MRSSIALQRMSFALVFLFLIFASPALSAGEKPSGIIRGTVSDENNRPVADAVVSAVLKADPEGGTSSGKTDIKGNFVISGLSLGEYEVSAEKPSAHYPTTPSAFYGTQSSTSSVQISQQDPSVVLKIAFHGKAPAITGKLIDDESSVAIPATLLFRHASDPANLLTIESDPNYFVLLPANVALTLEVSARGYKTWYYPGTNDFKKKKPMQLRRGEILKLNIRLDNEYEDCVCLRRPRRWGLGPDSPEFQWREMQDESRDRTCNRPSEFPHGNELNAHLEDLFSLNHTR